jgi:hypothetical protein
VIYLDANATTPLLPEVLDAMLPWLREGFHNPSASYAGAKEARRAIEEAREKVAALIGAEPDAAQVMLSEGTTMLVRGTSFSTPVRREVPIRSGDRIRTGPDGRVHLRFADGALMSIQPGSDFRIEAYAFDAVRQRSFFVLMQGSVRAVSGSIGRRDRDDFRLKTPTATIGIRGTEFTVEEAVCPPAGCAAGTAAGLTVAVIAGRVSVTNEAGSIEVPAGVTLRVRDARTAPALPSAPPRRRPAAGGGAGAGAGAKPLNAPMSSDDLGGGAR